MDSNVSRRKRIVAQGLAAIARARVRPRHSSERRRARFRLEGLEDRCLLSGISSITEFPVLTPGSVPNGITQGPDGNIWFTESAISGNKIGVINPTTHAVSEFNIPTANSGSRAITAGPDGNLWFTEPLTHKIGMINPNTHAISEFATSLGALGPFDITAGPDGNLWFAGGGSQIRRDQPNDPRRHLIHCPHRRFPSTGDHDGPRRQHLVHRESK
jgi:streptogramin lyase